MNMTHRIISSLVHLSPLSRLTASCLTFSVKKVTRHSCLARPNMVLAPKTLRLIVRAVFSRANCKICKNSVNSASVEVLLPSLSSTCQNDGSQFCLPYYMSCLEESLALARNLMQDGKHFSGGYVLAMTK